MSITEFESNYLSAHIFVRDLHGGRYIGSFRDSRLRGDYIDVILRRGLFLGGADFDSKHFLEQHEMLITGVVYIHAISEDDYDELLLEALSVNLPKPRKTPSFWGFLNPFKQTRSKSPNE